LKEGISAAITAKLKKETEAKKLEIQEND